MKKIKHASKKCCRGQLKEHEAKNWMVRPLVRQIRRQGLAQLDQGNRILNKLSEIDDSVTIIACDIAREKRA